MKVATAAAEMRLGGCVSAESVAAYDAHHFQELYQAGQGCPSCCTAPMYHETGDLTALHACKGHLNRGVVFLPAGHPVILCTGMAHPEIRGSMWNQTSQSLVIL